MLVTMTHGARRRLASLLWLVLLAVGLYVTACSSVLVTGPRGMDSASLRDDRTITVSLGASSPTFVTQATVGKVAANVQHFTIKLFNYNVGADSLGGLVWTHFTTSGQPRVVQFTGVGPGAYKVTAEAFQSSNDTLSITQGGPQLSTNHVTVAYGANPLYSSGGSLAVSMTLLNAAGDPVNLAADVQNGGASGPASHLAPGDQGSPASIHDFTVSKGGVDSVFVWIPRFTAYQLKNPTNCGTTMRFGTQDNARPKGYWVSSAPSAGSSVGGAPDWGEAVFGGFYVGKYEASRADATGGAAGSSTVLSVRSNVVPWDMIDWDQAASTCHAFTPACRLISGQEWAALAVHTMINNITVRGNNNIGLHFDDGAVTFSDDPTNNAASPGRTLTGSGPVSTSHTGAADGVYDLHGNVAEWIAEVDISAANKWVIGDVEATAVPSTNNLVAELAIAKGLDRFGLPGLVNAPGAAVFGFDSYFQGSAATNRKLNRGGAFDITTNAAGLWSIAGNARNTTSAAIGFRPVLRF